MEPETCGNILAYFHFTRQVSQLELTESPASHQSLMYKCFVLSDRLSATAHPL
jgi:hypothetical protein